ncbi:MAG: hypothetical protein IJR46_02475 [Neisseriaceae bacterium]|nr:hypothetical protein [Neisseriaceae bacterium]
MMNNEQKFFTHIKSKLFNGKLTQSQVDGINAVLDAISPFSIPEQAYMLATVYHETAKTMKPISEYGKGKGYAYGHWTVNSKNKRYCVKNSTKTSVYTFDEYPHLYYGRGYVQLTWFDNYLRAGRELAKVGLIDDEKLFLKNPEMANDENLAAQIMCFGMAQGWFTGKKLAHYFSGSLKNYKGARKIINGVDKADLIASYANIFETALRLAV